MSRIALIGIATLLLVAPGSLLAATIVEVPPGNGTLQAAIDAAVGPITLELSSGTYSGPVSITKPYLTIRSHHGTRLMIDAGCKAPVAFDIAADHFKLEGVASGNTFPIFVSGGTDREIVVASSSRVMLSRVIAYENCGTEPYGLEVNASDHVVLNRVAVDSPSYSHASAAEFVSIGPNAGVKARRLFANEAGILLVQDSGAPMLRAGPSFTEVASGSLHLVNSSGLRVVNGAFLDNITIDSTSDDNDFNGCVLTYSGSGAWADDGMGNCGTGNTGDIPVPRCP